MAEGEDDAAAQVAPGAVAAAIVLVRDASRAGTRPSRRARRHRPSPIAPSSIQLRIWRSPGWKRNWKPTRQASARRAISASRSSATPSNECDTGFSMKQRAARARRRQGRPARAAPSGCATSTARGRARERRPEVDRRPAGGGSGRSMRPPWPVRRSVTSETPSAAQVREVAPADRADARDHDRRRAALTAGAPGISRRCGGRAAAVLHGHEAPQHRRGRRPRAPPCRGPARRTRPTSSASPARRSSRSCGSCSRPRTRAPRAPGARSRGGARATFSFGCSLKMSGRPSAISRQRRMNAGRSSGLNVSRRQDVAPST